MGCHYAQRAWADARGQTIFIATRAVGLAVGANPIALMIPCHRVIQQNGKLGGYHGGETRKQAV